MATSLLAGMPSPLPSGDELTRVLRVNESAELRIQAISFFVVGLLVCAALFRWLWNFVAADFKLPRLTFGKALASVVLWGILFVLVLTMISGARELMTPGAWKKQGFTYKLADDAANVEPSEVRRTKLEQLRQSLWHFAATHNGRFPTDAEIATFPADLWVVPESPGLRFRYIAGLNANDAVAPLVIGPIVDAGKRLVLHSDGTIKVIASEGQP